MSSSEKGLAGRYAGALYELAVEAKATSPRDGLAWPRLLNQIESTKSFRSTNRAAPRADMFMLLMQKQQTLFSPI